jgi:D123
MAATSRVAWPRTPSTTGSADGSGFQAVSTNTVSQLEWRVPYPYGTATPFFIENWPQAWRARAPRWSLLPLSAEQCQALGALIVGCGHWFAPMDPSSLEPVRHWLDETIASQGGASFLRLGSRSPKDSPRAHRLGLRVQDAAEALALVTDGSQRCAADLRLALQHEQVSHLALRPWQDFAPWQELRCFIRDRRWVGASGLRGHMPAATTRCADWPTRLAGLVGHLIQHCPSDHAALDIVMAPSPWLLDANPWLQSTDQLLFDGSRFDATLRMQGPAGLCAWPLPAETSDDRKGACAAP